jgi:hypothetical protein
MQMAVSHNSFCTELQLLCLQAQGFHQQQSPGYPMTNTKLAIPTNTMTRICLPLDGTSRKDELRGPTVLQHGPRQSYASPTIFNIDNRIGVPSKKLLQLLLKL